MSVHNEVIRIENCSEILRTEIINKNQIKVYFVPKDNDSAEKKVNENDLNVILDVYYPIVNVEGISREDVFLKHIPESNNQIRVRRAAETVLYSKVKNFRIPKYAPAFVAEDYMIYTERKKKIYFFDAERYDEKIQIPFEKEKNAKIDSLFMYDIYLLTLIKELSKKVATVKAWRLVCDDSKELFRNYNWHLNGNKDFVYNFCDIGFPKLVQTSNGKKMVVGYLNHENNYENNSLANCYVPDEGMKAIPFITLNV